MKNKQTVLITGASSGIGYELAKIFSEKEYNLVLVSRNLNKLKKISDEFEEKYNVSPEIISIDLSKSESPEKILNILNEKSITIDILVNNAGLGIYGRFMETDIKKEIEIINVNIIALTILTKLLLPQIINSKHGKIMNVASTSSFIPGPFLSIYHASKAYVLSFSEAIAEELKEKSVIVTTLCPGATKTEWHKKAKMNNLKIVNSRAIDASIVANIGFKALMHGKRIVITGTINKIAVFIFRFIPSSIITKMGFTLLKNK